MAAATLPKFEQERLFIQDWFDGECRQGLKNHADTASYQRWLDTTEAQAIERYRKHENPIWKEIASCKDIACEKEWTELKGDEEPLPAYLWPEKLDYETNLHLLQEKLPMRKQDWLRRFKREDGRGLIYSGQPMGKTSADSLPYPTFVQHWDGRKKTVENPAALEALGRGWSLRDDFVPYLGPRPPRTDQLDPTTWVDDWTVPGLTGQHRVKIRAALWRVDGEFSKSPDAEGADVAAIKRAFDEIAKVLFDSGLLTEQFLQTEIPALAWDSAVAGGWWRYASETPGRIFPEQIGHYWVWRPDGRDWLGLFRAEAAGWRAQLLDGPTKEDPIPGTSVNLRAHRKTDAANSTKSHKHYEAIDAALRSIAKSSPSSHGEVFSQLEGRTKFPATEPFGTSMGWVKGFQKDPERARSWLSKRWSKLRLPAFPRGPKYLE